MSKLYRIKKLKWVEQGTYLVAKTVDGSYTIEPQADGTAVLYACFRSLGGIKLVRTHNVEDAKYGAQEHFEQWLISTRLEEVLNGLQ